MELLKRFQQGDLDAFEKLFRQFQADVYCWIVQIVRDPRRATNLCKNFNILDILERQGDCGNVGQHACTRFRCADDSWHHINRQIRKVRGGPRGSSQILGTISVQLRTRKNGVLVPKRHQVKHLEFLILLVRDQGVTVTKRTTKCNPKTS